MRALAAFPALMLLAACNQTTAPQAAPKPNSSPVPFVTPSTFSMPNGSGCSGEISRFRAIQDNELETGNVGQKVYDQIRVELRQPESLCASGNDAGARSALAGIKARHGYPG